MQRREGSWYTPLWRVLAHGFLLAGAIGMGAGGAVTVSSAAPASGRVIYSNDAVNILNASAADHAGASVVQRLQRSIDEAAAADTYFFQPGNGWVPWWRSRLYPADEHYRWYANEVGLPLHRIGEYMRDGGDLVAEFVAHCRRRGISPFVSLRMNDYHGAETHDVILDAWRDGSRPAAIPFGIGEAAAQSRFQLEHPEYRLRPDPGEYVTASPAERQRYLSEPSLRIRLRVARVLNWAIPAVREQKLGFLRELCEGYDIDGLELDFMRWGALFQLEETTKEQRTRIMLGFIREVKEALNRTSPPGRRRQLCVRIPLRESGHAPLGIDLPRWVEAGVDMVNLSCHFITQQQSDLASIRQAIPTVPLFLELTFASATVSWNRGDRDGRYRQITEEQLSTAAHLAYAHGANGVSLFNFAYFRTFGVHHREPPFELIPLLADPDALARGPQHYFLSHAGAPPAAPSEFSQRRVLAAGETTAWTFELAAPEGGWIGEGTFALFATPPVSAAEVEVKCNGVVLLAKAGSGVGEPAAEWVVPAAGLLDGRNIISVQPAPRGAPSRVDFVELRIPHTRTSTRGP